MSKEAKRDFIKEEDFPPADFKNLQQARDMLEQIVEDFHQLPDIKENQVKNSVRVYVHPKWEEKMCSAGGVPSAAASASSAIGYVPQFEKDAKDSYNLLVTHLTKQGFLAPAAEAPGTQENRTFSRLRVVAMSLTDKEAKAGPSKMEGAPQELVLLTCNLVNLMGSSPLDSKTFILAGKKLNIPAFRQACEETIELIVATAKLESARLNGPDAPAVLNTPAFGAGIYLQSLPDDQKKIARQIIVQTFIKAAQQHGVMVRWFIWNNDPNLKALQAEYQSYISPFEADLSFQLVVGDFVGEIGKPARWNEIFLNPGSDRTIGGMFTKPGAPLEEKIMLRFLFSILNIVLNRPLIQEAFRQRTKLIPAQLPNLEFTRPLQVPGPSPLLHLSITTSPPQSKRKGKGGEGYQPLASGDASKKDSEGCCGCNLM